VNRTSVFIFRHGETDWNRDHRLQGHSDIPLNPHGADQARDLALRLKSEGIELVLSSDLARALETARAVARESHAPIVVLPGLRETALGIAEGLTHDEIRSRLGADAWRRWASLHPMDAEFAFAGGESKVAHRHRLFDAMETALLRFPHSRVAVSTHGGALRRILHHIDPGLTEPAMIPNCRVFRFEFDRTARLWELSRAEGS